MVENKKSKTNISKRVLYTLIAIGILAVAGIGVYALVPGTAPNPGHTIDQLVPPTGCGNGTFLKWNTDNGGFWSCGAASTSSGLDDDQDGYIDWVFGGPDCYDNNASAHPGQEGYFTQQRGDGSFDYDCSGSAEKEYLTHATTCTTSISGSCAQYTCQASTCSTDRHSTSGGSNEIACGATYTAYLAADGGACGTCTASSFCNLGSCTAPTGSCRWNTAGPGSPWCSGKSVKMPCR
jgi:hypothetical protein